MANVKQVMIMVWNEKTRKNRYFRFKQSECMVDWQLVHKLVAKANSHIEKQKGLTRVMLFLSEDEKNRRCNTVYAYCVFQADIKNSYAYYFTPHIMILMIRRMLKTDLSDFYAVDNIWLAPQEIKYSDIFHYYTLEDIEDIHKILKYGGSYFIKNTGSYHLRINAWLLQNYPFLATAAYTGKKVSDCYTIGDLYCQTNEFYRAIKNAYGNNKNNIYRINASCGQITTCLTRQEFGRAAEKWWKKAPMTRFISGLSLGDWEK